MWSDSLKKNYLKKWLIVIMSDPNEEEREGEGALNYRLIFDPKNLWNNSREDLCLTIKGRYKQSYFEKQNIHSVVH